MKKFVAAPILLIFVLLTQANAANKSSSQEHRTIPATSGTINNESDLPMSKLQISISSVCSCEAFLGSTEGCGSKDITITPDANGHFSTAAVDYPLNFKKCKKDGSVEFDESLAVVTPNSDGDQGPLFDSIPTTELTITVQQIDPVTAHLTLPNGQDIEKWITSLPAGKENPAGKLRGCVVSNNGATGFDIYTKCFDITTSSIDVPGAVFVFAGAPNNLPQSTLTFDIYNPAGIAQFNFKKEMMYNRSMLQPLSQIALTPTN